MKKIFIILIIVIIPVLSQAQTGLEANTFFTKTPYRNLPGATETEIAGKALKDYNLSYYHGMSVDSAEDYLDRIQKMIEKDSRNATDIEKKYHNGRLKYCLLSFSNPSINRYLVYIDSGKNKSGRITMVYMEGKATRDDIAKMLRKK